MAINISRSLPVLPGNIIILPGCEPVSTVTSTTLQAEIVKNRLCINGSIPLQVALAAIPGSRVDVLVNQNGIPGKIFVFPEFEVDCNCQSTDYWEILRQAASDQADSAVESGSVECEGFTINPSNLAGLP